MKARKQVWPEKAIEDFASVITGGTPSTRKTEYWKDGTIPWLNSGELNKGVITSSDNFITEEGLKNSASKMMPENTVLVALTGATTGVSALLKIKACANQSVTGILASQSHDPNFLFRFFQLKRPKIVAESYGGAQQHISQGYVKKFKVPLPPLVEQKRIAKLLDEADELRKLRAQTDRRAAALVPALFHEMFGDPFTNPKNWPEMPFAETGKLDRGRSKNRPRDESSLYGGKYPFIQTGDVANANGTITQYTQTYSEKGLAQSRMWPAGTLVITIAANIGKTAILSFPACFPDSMVGLIPGKKVVVDYVRQWLVTMENRLEKVAPQMAQKNINLKILSELKIPVPPLALQKEFAERVTEIRALETAQATSRTRLDALFQSMLHHAFNGEL